MAELTVVRILLFSHIETAIPTYWIGVVGLLSMNLYVVILSTLRRRLPVWSASRTPTVDAALSLVEARESSSHSSEHTFIARPESAHDPPCTY